MEGFLGNVVKYLLFATNLLIFVTSLVALGIGIYVYQSGKDILKGISTEAGEEASIFLYSTASIMFIIISSAVVIIAFFGCCGAVKENRCMLGVYFVAVFITFVTILVAAVLGYTQTLKHLQEPMKKSLIKYDPASSKADSKVITAAWDKLQQDHRCCGISGYSDWVEQSAYFPTDDKKLVPESCCKGFVKKDQMDSCLKQPGSIKDGEKLTGCLEKLGGTIANHQDKILAVSVVVLIVMLLNILFSFAMCVMIH